MPAMETQGTPGPGRRRSEGVALGGLVFARQVRPDKRLDGELAGRVGRVEQRMTPLKGLIEGTG